MTETSALLLLLLVGVISVCAVVMTCACLSLLSDMRQLLRESHQTVGEAHRILARTNRAAGQAEALIQKTYRAFSGALELPLAFLSDRLGNGVRSNGSRRHVSRNK